MPTPEEWADINRANPKRPDIEFTVRDIEGRGWRAVRDYKKKVYILTCPHGVEKEMSMNPRASTLSGIIKECRHH
jgi:hypothetical protein